MAFLYPATAPTTFVERNAYNNLDTQEFDHPSARESRLKDILREFGPSVVSLYPLHSPNLLNLLQQVTPPTQ